MAKDDTVVILDQASGYLQIDMLDALSKKYKKCVIIAGTIVERETKLSEDYVWHEIVKYDKKTPVRRIYTWVLASLQMFFLLFFKYRAARVIAITNPPFAPFVPYMLKLNYDVLVYDLILDALVNFSYVKKKSWIVERAESLSKKMFKNAQNIYTLTPELAEQVRNYTDKDIKIVPIWTNNDFFKRINKDENLIIEKLQIDKSKFVVTYSGNLGKTHPVELIVALAEVCTEENFYFIIIGGGHKFELIKSLIAEKNISNITLLPWQPIELLPHNMQAGDVNVVTLEEDASHLSIPSKTFNLLSVGKPILALCSEKSALAKLIDTHACGKSFKSKDLLLIKDFLIELSINQKKYDDYAENAKKASFSFTKENAKSFL